MAKIVPLYSGSSGNSTYIGTSSQGVLVDVGKSARMTCKALEASGIPTDAIRAILVTHEHSDHVSGVDVLARKLQVPVCGTAGTLQELERKKLVAPSVRLLPLEGAAEFGDMRVTLFRTQHDSADCCGFTVEIENKKAGIATDLGMVTPMVLDILAGCGAVMLESNYDVDMLRQSLYPYPLKQRIASPTGHLANRDCAAALPHLVEKGVLQIILAHLSQQNNLPALAKDTSVRGLAAFEMKENVDYQLRVARRNEVTDPVIF